MTDTTKQIIQNRNVKKGAGAKATSWLGISLILAAIVYGFWDIQRLQSEIEVKQAALDSTKQASELVRQAINRIENSTLAELIEVKSIAIARDDLIGANNPSTGEPYQLYNFVIWLDLPHGRKADIEEVEYNFNNSSFLNRTPTSTEKSNGFAHGYLGWGLLPIVPITVKPNNGEQPFVINFPMSSVTTLLN